jgi:Na+/melibiose symporter-like transporter
MAIMATWGPAWFSCSREMFVLGLTLYNCAAALTPLVLAPLSENMGRSEIYQVTSFLWVILLFILALTRQGRCALYSPDSVAQHLRLPCCSLVCELTLSSPKS